jgi:Uma2 family endonuclease
MPLPKIEPLMTVADLDILPEDNNRYELIGGYLLVSRAASVPHQKVIYNIVLPIGNYLAANPVGEIIITPGVIFSDYDAVIPDLVFITTERIPEVIPGGNKIEGAPDLAIEVVSPGKENSERDRLWKRQLYAQYGVGEYWVIDAWQRTIEVYRLRNNSLEMLEKLRYNDTLSSPLLPDLLLPVADVFRF